MDNRPAFCRPPVRIPEPRNPLEALLRHITRELYAFKDVAAMAAMLAAAGVKGRRGGVADAPLAVWLRRRLDEHAEGRGAVVEVVAGIATARRRSLPASSVLCDVARRLEVWFDDGRLPGIDAEPIRRGSRGDAGGKGAFHRPAPGLAVRKGYDDADVAAAMKDEVVREASQGAVLYRAGYADGRDGDVASGKGGTGGTARGTR